MAEHYRRFPIPPSGVPLEIERRPDRIIVSIKRDRAMARQVLARFIPAPTLIMWTLMRYTIAPALLMMIGMSVLFAWVGTRIREVEARLFAFACAGMSLIAFVLSVLWIRRGISAPVIFWSGRFPWRLEVSHDCWRFVRPNTLFGEYSHQIRPSLVTRVYVDAQSKVIAYEGARLMIVSPPMLPEAAAWLADALAGQVGPHVLRDVAEDEAKFYTAS